MRTEDGHIIRECLNGDSASFGLLVDKYKESIYALAYSRLRNFHDAEDITQDVFLKAYRNLRTLRRWDSFLVWIRSITINLCKNRIRTQSRRPDAESIEDQETQILDKVSADFYSDEQSSISRDEALDSLNKALESLPGIYQQVLTLHYLGGMSGEQMSQFLGISHANVRQRLSRARRQLREETLAMMSSTYEQQKLPAGFTFRVVEAVKRIKIHPMPRVAGLPWGLSLAAGIIVAVLSLNPYIALQNPIYMSTGSTLSSQTKVMKAGEIPVDILKISQIPFISTSQRDSDSGAFMSAGQQNALFHAPSAEGDTWIMKADMPTARHYLSTCTVNDKIYAIGGVAANSPLSTVEEYDPSTDTWTEKADMPTARWGLSTCAVNGRIYAIGGCRGVYLSTVEEYDPIADNWITKSDMPTKRAWLTASVVNGKIYAIGGTGWDNSLSIVEEYDPVTDIWSRKADMPTARETSSAALNGKIYVIGGMIMLQDSSVCLSTVEEYDPVGDIWTVKAKMPTKRAHLATSAVGEKIYAIGGSSWWPVVTHATVEEYDTITDKWMKVSDMPTARWGLSASVVNDRIYAIGGADSNNIGLSISEEYDTGHSSKIVEPKEKLATPWGGIKSD